jgi:DNA-directed RNA polymerase specialized sigma24 family protein
VNNRTDQQLLCDYAEHHSETAFTELVRRHVDIVHSAAFRMTGEAHSAQDVAQAVFVALAQNAGRMTHHPVLSGWLHTTARNLAAKHVRTAVRRQSHEQEAAA